MNKIHLLGETKERMVNELKGKKKTAKELSDVLGIQVSATRKHLEMLSELKIVEEEFIQDGIGRPKKFYALTDGGLELFPRQYERILCTLLDKVDASEGNIGEPFLKLVAREIAQDMNTAFSGELGEDGKHAKVERLVKALDDFGFDTSLEEREGKFVITSRNCPLYKAAMKHQKMVCHGFHDEIIKSALGTRDVKLETCVSRGDIECKHVIGAKSMKEAF